MELPTHRLCRAQFGMKTISITYRISRSVAPIHIFKNTLHLNRSRFIFSLHFISTSVIPSLLFSSGDFVPSHFHTGWFVVYLLSFAASLQIRNYFFSIASELKLWREFLSTLYYQHQNAMMPAACGRMKPDPVYSYRPTSMRWSGLIRNVLGMTGKVFLFNNSNRFSLHIIIVREILHFAIAHTSCGLGTLPPSCPHSYDEQI